MSISIRCPECGRESKAKDAFAGKTVRCKDCGAVIRIRSPIEESPEGPADAKGSPSGLPLKLIVAIPCGCLFVLFLLTLGAGVFYLAVGKTTMNLERDFVVETIVGEYYKTSGEFDYADKLTYVYDDRGRETELYYHQKKSTWGDWELYWKDMKSYDENSYLDNTTSYLWRKGAFIKNRREDYFYDEEDRVEALQSRDFQQGGTSAHRTRYLYDELDRLAEEDSVLEYAEQGGGMKSVRSRYTYKYHDDGRVASKHTLNLKDGEWAEVAREVHSYDEKGRLICSAYVAPDPITWEERYKTTYAYSADNRVECRTSFFNDTGEMEARYRETYTYDDQEMLVSKTSYTKHGTEWVKGHKKILSFKAVEGRPVLHVDFDPNPLAWKAHEYYGENVNRYQSAR